MRLGSMPLLLEYGSAKCLTLEESAEPEPLPNAERVPFRDFNNQYAGGTCYIVGRGPTEFCYDELGAVSDPIFFINDAVCLEKYAKSETFFFAHDVQMRPWLDGSIRATAVLPRHGGIMEGAPGSVLGHGGRVVYYSHSGQPGTRELLLMSRDEIADWQRLAVHSGTIHSALHFAWFCGFRRVVFIGCDGINPGQIAAGADDVNYGYDRRLRNKSYSSPGPYYNTIRKAQDLLTYILGIETIYRGTPRGFAGK